MARTVAIGAQGFAEIREGGAFYVDKTGFVRDWFEDGERTLAVVVASALAQIRDKRYAASLEERGIAPGRIRCYGMAFEGRRVLVG